MKKTFKSVQKISNMGKLINPRVCIAQKLLALNAIEFVLAFLN